MEVHQSTGLIIVGYVYMYVCMHIYVCMYVCTYVCTYSETVSLNLHPITQVVPPDHFSQYGCE